MSSKRAKNQPWELDPKVLRRGMILRAERSTELQAKLAFAAIPALLDHYLEKCVAVFEAAARPLLPPQRVELRGLLARALQTGFEHSAHAKVVLQFTSDPPPQSTLSCQIGVEAKGITDIYAGWRVRESGPPYFGAHADAKLLGLLREVAKGSRALDIGAGTGRNSLPMAAAGLQVDAVEMTPSFVATLREAAASAKASINVLEGDAFDPALGLPASGYALILASEVISSHARDTADLRDFFQFAADRLAPGGVLLCNVFVARSGYAPDLLARQLSSSVLTSLFSHADLESAVAGLPLALVSNEPCVAYEREHLPPDAWPPTAWYEAWANGCDLFDLSTQPPCELRWFVFRKS